MAPLEPAYAEVDFDLFKLVGIVEKQNYQRWYELWDTPFLFTGPILEKGCSLHSRRAHRPNHLVCPIHFVVVVFIVDDSSSSSLVIERVLPGR